jgi:hypothetical protein
MGLCARQKEKSEGEDEIDGKELQALEPIGPAVTRHLSSDEPDRRTISTSPAGKARSSVARPMIRLANTKTGATKSATCTLEPIAIDSDKSMRSFKAALMAVACSAAFPRIATTKTPTNTLLRPKLRPNSCAVGSIAPTMISLIQAINAVAPASKRGTADRNLCVTPFRLIESHEECRMGDEYED